MQDQACRQCCGHSIEPLLRLPLHLPSSPLRALAFSLFSQVSLFPLTSLSLGILASSLLLSLPHFLLHLKTNLIYSPLLLEFTFKQMVDTLQWARTIE